jgi:hypothetical protein
MGEPFHSTDALSGAEHWFAQADADRDGRILPGEMRADAAHFFGLLDTDRDGMIGPDEIERYETEIAPEIRVGSTYGDPSKAKSDTDGNVTPPPYPTRLGAGRFGYLDMPEPIVSADVNLDRAITRTEFLAAADRRFRILDADADGAITRGELPRLDARVADDRPGRRKGRGQREGRSHWRGGEPDTGGTIPR